MCGAVFEREEKHNTGHFHVLQMMWEKKKKKFNPCWPNTNMNLFSCNKSIGVACLG